MPDKEREAEAAGFKVTDRRLFTPEGERRPTLEPEPPPEQKPPPAPPPQRPAAEAPPPQTVPEAPGVQAPSERQGPVNFDHLVMSLATTAMFQLGLVPNPGEENPRIDLPAAKETIDLLEILQQKTKGNLTEEEEGLLEGSLYELHMAFVELSRRAERGP